MDISVVIPLYNEEESLPELLAWIGRVMAANNFTYEIIMVDDGSNDKSWKVIEQLSAKNNHIRGIKFRRNYGKSAALHCGFEDAQGDVVITMDADLQDPPSLLPEMLKILESGEYDSVATRRVTRKGEPPIRSFFARMFYKIINKMSSTEIVDGARDFRLMKRKMVDAILRDAEYNRFTKGIYSWVGFHTKWIAFENVERSAGETKWSFWKLLLYAIDGMVAFSTMPLSVAALIGILMCVIAAISIIFIIVRQLCFGGSAFGWPSMVCIMIFIGGVQLLCMGIMGQYLAKTYLEVKNRPIYICKETNIEE